MTTMKEVAACFGETWKSRVEAGLGGHGYGQVVSNAYARGLLQRREIDREDARRRVAQSGSVVYEYKRAD